MAFLPGIFGRQNQQPQNPPPQGGGQQQQVPQGQQAPQGGSQQASQQQQPNNGMFANGGVPGAGPGNGSQGQQSGGGQQQPANPLDNWMKLMTPQQQQQQQQQQQAPKMFGDLTPEKMKEMVGQTNFAQNIDPELAQKALGGDIQSFQQVLNSVAQNVFSSSLQMGQGMVEHGVNFGNQQLSGSLDSRIRDFQVRNQNSENPALQHPIGQALLGSVKKQIAAAQPKLSPQEVHTQAEQMFKDFAQMLVPQQNNQGGGQEQPPSQDWSMFLNDTPTQ